MKYHERIGAIKNLTMEAIIEDCRNHIPAQHKYRPYFHPELNHGLDLLQSDEALDCYIGAYGEMHHSKCKAVLQNLPFPPEEKIEGGLSVEIVDWGCGQGIGAVSIIDFLKERDLTQWLKKVTLIEPSEAALSRAIVNVTKATAQRIRVVPINAYLPADGNHTIFGTSFKNSKEGINKLKHDIALNSIDKLTFREVTPITVEGKRALMFKIAAAPRNIVVKWKGIAYGRDGESLVPLNQSKSESRKSWIITEAGKKYLNS